MPRTFLRIPPEIISSIVDNMLKMNHECEKPAPWFWADTEPEPYFNPLQRYKDALSLARTCKTLYNLLIKQIYRTDVRNNESSALLRSVKLCSLEGVRRSLDAGADIDIRDPLESDQTTAIHWASYLGHKNIVSLLLERGDDVNRRVRVEVGAFSCDIVEVNVEASIICLEGVQEEVTRWTLEHGANPLYFAILGGDWDTIQLLIHAGAEFVTHTGCGVHALHQAASHGDAGLVESLLEHESVVANLNTILDNRGATALHYLNHIDDDEAENCKIIRKLVEHGHQVSTTDGYDALPIEEAISKRSNMITAEFIRNGSLIPVELRFHIFGDNYLETIKALAEAKHRGFPLRFHRANPPMVTTFLARIRTYHHFYKLVYQTGQVPGPMNSYDPDQWEVFWASRPFV
ncbi:hypothetical protein FVEN_g7466 [Fusarium venenatum]|nr:hypothetical protein FVEN_g7466 [Fusarium venenatum]